MRILPALAALLPLIDENFVITHLTVYENENKSRLEIPTLISTAIPESSILHA